MLKFLLTEEEKRVIDRVADAARTLSMPAFLVGGFIRDKLLRRPCKDLDFVTVGKGSGIKLAEEVARQNASRVTIFKNFGTAQVKLHDYDIEFVGARRESYRKNSRKPLVEDGTLEDDLHRRDFTINAMAWQVAPEMGDELEDLFHGIRDLDKGYLRTPLDPDHTFADDPLRMLRGIRLATELRFHIVKTCYKAIRDQHDRLRIVSKERITDELNRIIMTKKPSVGFKLLFDTKLLGVILPELAALQGVEVKDRIAHKDNFFHTLQVLDNLARTSDDLWLRWSALLHDIAKPDTKRFDKKDGWTFHGHEAVGARMVPSIFRRLKLPMNEHMKFVQKMVELHLRPIALSSEEVTDSGIRRLLFDAGDDVDQLMLLCEADITSKNEKKVAQYLRNFEIVRQKLKEVEGKDRLRNWQPPVDGQLIMETFGLKPCKEVGIIKTAIREAILDGDIGNNFDEAYAFMLNKGKELELTPQHAGSEKLK